jgi:hypothetical protein
MTTVQKHDKHTLCFLHKALLRATLTVPRAIMNHAGLS